MKLKQECECVRLRAAYVCVCALALRLAQTAFNEATYGGTRVYHLPPPPSPPQPHPSVQPNPPLCHLLRHTHTHTIRHLHTPSHLNLTRKKKRKNSLHIRPAEVTALFLNPPTHHQEEKIYNTITVSALLVTASILILKDG